MPGVPRVGVNLKAKHGHVVVASVVPDSPASAFLCKNDVVLQVNGVAVGDDAQAAQKAIVAATQQCTKTGQMLPVRLAIGQLALHSPKGIDADFGLILGAEEAVAEELEAEEPPQQHKRQPGVREVVQVL